MEVVYCVMKKHGVLFAIYETGEKAENVANKMSEEYKEKYYVETRTIL